MRSATGRVGANGADSAQQAYHRGMATTQEPAEHEQRPALSPLPGALNLLDDADDSVGYCSGGVCHFPAPKKQ
jgi:hypothetical protein